MCCDVGGTSTDVSLVVDGRPFVQNTFELEHDLIINALSTEVSSVGAGGGSIVSISPSGDVRVGPESAGAEPGPACYGWGGELPTVTDACLLMGILDPEGFASGEVHLDSDRARAAFERLDTPLSVDQRIAFAYRIAVNNIAEEVTNIAIRHGVDPRDFSLLAYGAAGPMLLPAALELLHVKQVVIPPHPGLFSALGLLSTDQVYSDSRSAYLVLTPDAAPQVAAVFDDMERRLRERVGTADGVTVRRSFDGRLYGQSWETPFVAVPDGPITADTIDEMVERFHAEYGRRFGNTFPLPVQGVTYRVELVVEADKVQYTPAETNGKVGEPQPARTIELRHYADEPLQAAEYERDALPPGSSVDGPAIIREGLSTTFVCPGQVATVGRFRELLITRAEER
jgi:N-methylhydantoinase A